MLATFLDIALGFVGKAACGEELLTPTISLSMDFLRPASRGEWVESRTRLVHQTRRMFFVEGTLVTVEGPIVRASAIYNRRARGAPETS
jgi:acyl-coenzyme A thioesterase PaaI-like protein